MKKLIAALLVGIFAGSASASVVHCEDFLKLSRPMQDRVMENQTRKYLLPLPARRQALDLMDSPSQHVLHRNVVRRCTAHPLLPVAQAVNKSTDMIR